ncbi:class D sortase [Fonticella tunisiensis]|uniref:Sortase A n=1 Tax=Fonticella tunisiensis TaxID=1096341 RepID=A0A4R7KBD6_9CLOT|nr:class D sortase [Fonticella tunisiensis]TDT50927.1 sortase A [Fonticella tunisiensis]
MKKAGYILIVLGLGILIYVGINQYFVYREQRALMNTINQISQNTTSKQITQTEAKESKGPSNAIGILEIPSINLSVAIVEGSTQKDLKYAVGHIEGTGELGKPDQNFAIAGHRSYTAGRFFNRLDKVKIGDMIYIKTKDKLYTYRVFKTEVVLPEQVEVLEPQKGKSLVTLITCTPLYKSTHRLIVYSELTSEENNPGN